MGEQAILWLCHMGIHERQADSAQRQRPQRLAINSAANAEPSFEDAAPLLSDKWLCRLAVTASAAEGHTE